jgi:hypothetical protein
MHSHLGGQFSRSKKHQTQIPLASAVIEKPSSCIVPRDVGNVDRNTVGVEIRKIARHIEVQQPFLDPRDGVSVAVRLEGDHTPGLETNGV